jgi:hypothetical protein
VKRERTHGRLDAEFDWLNEIPSRSHASLEVAVKEAAAVAVVTDKKQ